MFVEMVVVPDGSTRNPRILYAVPPGVFEPAVRTMVLHMRFKPREPRTKPAHCQLMYRFEVRQRSAADYPDLQKFVGVTHKKAEAGDIDAELVYGMLLAGLPQLGHTRSDALPWFLKAAQGGPGARNMWWVRACCSAWAATARRTKGRSGVSTDPTVFEIRAAAQAASGAFADAVGSERRAIAMGSRLNWDLGPLNERLARYESRQAWYGDLSGL